jgi:hypothetical protein
MLDKDTPIQIASSSVFGEIFDVIAYKDRLFLSTAVGIFSSFMAPINWVELQGPTPSATGQLMLDGSRLLVSFDGVQYLDLESSKVQEARAPDEFVICPNPATVALTIRGMEENGSIEVIDALGAVKLRQEVPKGSTTTTIAVDGLTPGFYFVVARSGDHVRASKVLIRH